MNTSKLYVLKDPETLEIRYVGITIRTLQKRLSGHICDAKCRPELNYHKINWIKSILKKGLKPIIELVLEYDSLDLAKQAEMDYIAKYKQEYKLTNCTIGGDHLGERSHSRESILKKSTTRAICQYNIFGELLREFEITEDAARFLNLSSASKITMCCKKLRPHSHGYIWRYKGDELGDISNIDVFSLSFNRLVQFDLEGNYIADYDSYLAASLIVGDHSKGGNIVSACKGIQKHCKGFQWKLEPNFEYLDESFLLINNDPSIKKSLIGKSGKKVNQYDINNNFLKTFNSISDASIEVLGTINGRKKIVECCEDFDLKYKNYKWQYCPLEE